MPVMFPRGRRVHPIPRTPLERVVDCVDLEVEIDDETLAVDASDDTLAVDVDEC